MTGIVVSGGLALLVAIELAHRLWAADWRPTNKGERAICLALAAATTVFTLAIPPVAEKLRQLSGHPNLPALLIAAIAVFGGWTLYPFVEHYWTGTPARRGISDSPWLMVATIAAITALEVAATHAGASRRHGLLPLTFAAQSIFTGYMGLTAFRMERIAVRCRRLVEAPRERRQMDAYILGWVLAVAANAHAQLVLTARQFDLPLYTTPSPSRVTVGLLICCITLLNSGALLEFHERRRQARTHHHLGPLWRLIHEAVPQAILFPPTTGDDEGGTIGEPKLALYNRVFEIRDGLRELRRYADPAVAEWAAGLCRQAGLHGAEAQATIDAAILDDALRARAQGRAPRHLMGVPAGPAASDLADAASYLLKVDRAYRRSPIVAAMRAGRAAETAIPQGAA